MVEKTAQEDVWVIRGRRGVDTGWEMMGLCATYVDDIIIAGTEKVILYDGSDQDP